MIEVRGLTRTFGGLVAVDDCSLDIASGRITGLIGPNGAGKTTLFNTIAGYFRPDSGTVRLDGVDVTGLPAHALFHRGLMRTFQIPRVFDRMSVRENLMVVPPGQRGENMLAAWFAPRPVRAQDADISARADEVLTTLNLTALADARAGNLSGGQKKLVELGRAMISGGRTILLDEPGAGVNPTLLAELAGHIERLNRDSGYTFCIIEHNMDLVARLCDRVVVMSEGRVLTAGTFDEVRADPTVLDAYFGHTGRTAGASGH